MRKALILINNKPAAIFTEESKGGKCTIAYLPEHQGSAISLTLPLHKSPYEFPGFPAFFDGLLPEGPQLEGLLKRSKIDRDDYFAQLMAVGADLVGAVNVKEITG